MTSPWGQTALSAGWPISSTGWTAGIADLLKELSNILFWPEFTSPSSPKIRYVCQKSHSLIVFFEFKDSSASEGIGAAFWQSPAFFDDPNGFMLERQIHYGLIPHHIVGTAGATSRPLLGANIGGIIHATCRCSRFNIHTREIEREHTEKARRRVVLGTP
jgi:hypothetical protein